MGPPTYPSMAPPTSGLQRTLKSRAQPSRSGGGRVTLGVQDTKTRRGRQPRLTSRVIEAVRQLPKHISSPYVFPNPKTGRPYDTTTIYDQYQIAVEAAGLKGSGARVYGFTICDAAS
jgi:hypothetical protein